MAGDGGRVPDVSEQRTVHEAGIYEASVIEELAQRQEVSAGVWASAFIAATARTPETAGDFETMLCWFSVAIMAGYDRAKTETCDPASVLAALLAESPEATVAAIEALLTSDEAHIAAAAVVSARERLSPTGVRALDTSEAALRAACRSLLSKAPKEDG
jgi:hypothetical protein